MCQAATQARDAYVALALEDLYLRAQLRNWSAAFAVCAWRGLARSGAGALLRVAKGAPDADAWAADSNDFVVFALKASLFAYLANTRNPCLHEVRGMLTTHVDTLLGYPDCCWGWCGPGVLRDLVRSSFLAMVVGPQFHLLPKSAWPRHCEAVMMARSPRLGARAALGLLDDDLLRAILRLAVAPEASRRSVTLE